MHLTTKALVLRDVGYKESDQILTLLTLQAGKITATARGSRRKNSPLAAGCQLLCWSEFVLYEFKGRWSVKEAVAERQFAGVRRDLTRFSLACYLSELAEVMAMEGEGAPELLSLILNCLHVLDKKPEIPSPLVKTVYEIRLMAISGYAPATDCCAVCGEQPQMAHIHLREGILHCARCRAGTGEGKSLPLTGGALAALGHIAWCQGKRLFSFEMDEQSARLLGEFSEEYLLTQLERGFRTLDFYQQLPPLPPDGGEGT